MGHAEQIVLVTKYGSDDLREEQNATRLAWRYGFSMFKIEKRIRELTLDAAVQFVYNIIRIRYEQKQKIRKGEQQNGSSN